MISIVMPNYNKEDFIAEAINSIFRQTNPNWELIVVDDCSTDDSIKIISSMSSKNDKVKLIINSENRGANYCRNIGVKNSSFDWVMFFDSDDVLNKVCVENRIGFINNNGKQDFFVFTMKSFEYSISDNNKLWIPNKKNALNRFLSHNLPWQTMQTLWFKPSIKKINGFDVSFKRMQDVEIHTRALLNKFSFKISKGDPDCFYRIVQNRIKDYQNYIGLYSESVLKFHLNFFFICSKIQKKLLFFTLVETLIYIENISKNNKVDPIFLVQIRKNYLDVADSNLRYFVLKVISTVYSNKFFYPYGLKFIIKVILNFEIYFKK